MNKSNIHNHRLSVFHGFRLTVALLLLGLMAAGNVSAQVTVRGNVFGGGNEAPVSGSVEVNMTGGTVNGDVYGGGAKADTNTDNWDTTNNTWATGKVDGNGATTNKTVVKLNGGTIEGDAYGGGLGDLVGVGAGHSDVEAKVYGDIIVYLGGDADGATGTATKFHITNYTDNNNEDDIDATTIVKSGRVFGCNNLNGSPLGNVTVNVYKTVAYDNVQKRTEEDTDHPGKPKNTGVTPTYEVAAVYGGGNLANYTTTGKKTYVNILTCDVSVESVYGGGNAAAVPGTEVVVKGAYEIGFVFGGGNGKDPWTLDNGASWTANAGADVNGNANTLLNGGFVHEAYGGSNEKGNITGSASLVANETLDRACDLDVEKLVGAGKNADIDGDAILILGCMPETKIKWIYGGADNANVNGNVELTITSGNIGQVFGGNNESGMIKGHIKVNIEETGCRPINIDELYLGGNKAAYSIYGYYDSGETDAQTGKKIYLPRTSVDDHTAEAVENPSNADGKHPYPYADPELNIISCTSIGQVFGGGLGENAKMYGNPTVNVDQIFGKAYVDNDPSKAYTEKATTLGSVGDVYGGGKEAHVFGKATVNIGTTTTVALVTEPTHLGASGTAYTHNTTTDLYEVDVQGAKLTGNVYGGGKQADINGDTEVNVGTVTYNTENHVGVSIANAKNVFGGGEGQNTTVTGDVTVNIGKDNSGSFTGNSVVGGDIYGGSALGAVNATKGTGYASDPSDISATSGKETKVNIYAGTVNGNVFGGGLGQKNGLNGATSDIAAQNFGDATVTMKGGTVSTAIYGGANVNGTLKANSTVKIIGGTVNAVPGEGESLADAVFGGGLGESTSVVGNVVVNIGNYDADAEPNKITGNATVNGHVYGGSAKGKVNNADAGIADDDTQAKTKQTNVNLYAGTVTGDIYGGGLGTADVAAQGDNPAVTGIAAIVYGDVAVKLNAHDGTASVGGRVFGCNNLKGSPKGAVTVDIYKTSRKDNDGNVIATKPARIGDPDPTNDPKPSAYLTATDTQVDNQTYELAAVFGGGNQAAYAPTNSSGVTTVNIHNCETNSIKEVYGGGNAADVPNCAVNIDGAWEIGYVYGGGNGTTDVAANVTGNATTTIRGGIIYRTFGGSNTHGDIGASTLDIADGTGDDACVLKLGDVFSYGNKAEMNHPATVNLSCLANKVGALYGGAMNANVNSDITLNVNGGSYAKVFGGNKTGGSINGFITVNVEETGACAVNIDELFGCGNEAPYSVYGTEKNSSDQWVVKTEGNTRQPDPQVNLYSFTNIGAVYGAGLGSSAEVWGNPSVNINITKASGYTLTNVYGGGYGADVTGNTTINIADRANVTLPSNSTSTAVSGAAISGDVFGGGYGASTHVTGTATINIGERSGSAGSYTYTDRGASFLSTSNIYGGSALGTVATSEVNLYAGTIAANVFGGGKGRLASGTEGQEDYVEAQGATISTKATVNLCAATVTGNIYGGCNDNGTTAEAELNLLGGTVGTSGSVGDMVFGGGKGHATTTTTAKVNVGSDTSTGTSSIYSNVYGGSALGAVGTAIVDLNSVTTLTGHVFGGGMGCLASGTEGQSDYVAAQPATITTSATVNQNGITLAADKDIYGGCNINGTAAATFVYLMDGRVHDVFGGGLGEHTGVTGNVLVEVGHYNSTADALSGTATVTHDVYGGSAKGAVNTNTDNTTTVNLWKGTINGDVYGGGLGVKSNTPKENILAVVNGNVRVNLNGYDSGTETVTPVSKGECVVKGSIFGGNNANGSPAGTSEVHIYKTVGYTPDHERTASNKLTSATSSDHTYELAAVYGGGNEAAFTGVTTNVVIETCDPSIETVYGGGNAADATNTRVEVKGAYEINEVFGGGNGYSETDNHTDPSAPNYNPGAFVSGTATTVLNGGLIHDFYGGSNSWGTIGTYSGGVASGGPVITIDDLFTKNGTGCLLQFDNIYGAGKSAHVDGNISMTMGCLSDAFTVQNLYGGAKAADVKGNVTLTVTSGQFTNVFGGNDASGTIGGNITVNVEETGCQPLIIANVYGGGNLAPYKGKTTVNLKSFTSVGNVYGGGLGVTAIVTGSTTVNVNQVPGVKATLIDADDEVGADNNPNALGTIGNVYGGGSEASVVGSTRVNIGTLSKVTMASLEDDPSTTEDERIKNVTGVNITGNVFGGGYGASTNVSENVDVVIGFFENNYSPAIGGDVYGGSALGTVNGKTPTTDYHTYVTLSKGTVTGSIYGGGLGQKNGVNGATSDVEATVNGAVKVTVNGGKAANVFGCNNLNGSPQSTVAVYIKATDPVSDGSFAIGNVYGGGNQAKYTYTGTTPLLVEISGGTTYSTLYQTCTIGNVYGGGLSADVAGSINVNIKGGKVIGDVYGGGALANTNTANWTVDKESDWGKWEYSTVTLEETEYYEPLGMLRSGEDISGQGLYVKNNNQYVQTDDVTATGTTEYYRLHTGKISAGYYIKEGDNYIPAPTDWAVEETQYYSRQIKGAWNSSGTPYKTEVNMTGGVIGNAYGGGLGNTDISAIVYGDVKVTLGNGTKATGLVQNMETPAGSNTAVPVSGRVFGCNNINGTPLGNVTVRVNNTQQLDGNEQHISGHPDNKYDVHSVYGGGNQARYEPASSKETKVMIYGCEKTSIEKVFGGGNSAAVPNTTVVILGTHRIGYVFGGGNGADMVKKGSTWVANDGAPVYGDATVIAVGGRIGMTFAGSDTKGTVWGNATTILNDGNGSNVSEYIEEGSDYCNYLKITHSYGAGRGADINSNVNFIVNGCTNSQIETIFGGSYDANIRGDINLTITGGIYTQVFGGNDHGGYIGGNINVDIEESETCNPTIIQYLYGGCREAAYPGAGAEAIGGAKVSRGKITVNVKSATRIDNVYGGGWRAVVNGDTEVNVNMIRGSKAGQTVTIPTGYRGNLIPNSDMRISYNVITVTPGETIVTGLYKKDGDKYIQITEQEEKAEEGETYYEGILTSTFKIDNEIGTIGNVYGGSYQSEIHGNATVNIGKEAQVEILKRKDEVDDGELVHAGADFVDGENAPVYTNGVLTGTLTYVKKPARGVHITGNVYGGGDLAVMDKYEVKTTVDSNNDGEPDKDGSGNPIYTTTYAGGNTFVNICAVKDGSVSTQYNAVSFTDLAAGTPAIQVEGNVYGGGRGLADNFFCRQGMVGHEGDNEGQDPDTNDGTTVRIGNGTIRGSVYGGGEVARVEWSSHVTVGLSTGVTSSPIIEGSVYGGGKGVSTHGYSALLRGDTHVTIQANAKVRKCVYGGGEIASVGRYNVATESNAAQYGVEPGMPYSLFDAMTGQCHVTVQGNAEIGPKEAMTMPTFLGNVFGGGKGVLPYEGYAADEDPWRMPPTNERQYYTSKEKAAYLKYVETLALATRTYVTIDGNAFVKGSVYGGSEEGIVQQNTLVKIKGGQIGAGYDYDTSAALAKYDDGDFIDPTDPLTTATAIATKAGILKECHHWAYQDPYATYDEYASTTGYDSKGGATTGSDGHTYYGNVFGGGCGKDPYRAGEWHNRAGAVGGNTEVRITGGHILTNVYGGNEMTNVGTDGVDTTGVCIITMSGGTLGVPRTLDQIKNHPVTCYLFGAGKGDQRVLFNKETNVRDVVVSVTGGTIYGSVFGGGEDGHVMRDVTMTIGNTDGTGPKIGTWGTSYVDGNVFGGGRGFAGDSYTAGNVAGSIDLSIKGGTMLGSIYGGGRLGSVGYGLYDVDVDGYGEMCDDDKLDNGTTTSFYNSRIANWHNLGRGRGYVNVNISGGTIGNKYEFVDVPTNTSDLATWKTTNHVPKTEYNTTTTTEGNTTTYTHRLKHTKGGNVFAGSMGRRTKLDDTPIPEPTQPGDIDWRKLGNAKSTKLTISGTPWIMGNVYGGCEFGKVTGNHNLLDGEGAPIKDANNEIMVAGTEIVVTGGTIGTEITASAPVKETVAASGTVKYTFGSIYGGGMGIKTDGGGEVKDSTNVKVSGSTTLVRASVFGGGEMGDVDGNTLVTIAGGKIGRNEVRPKDANDPEEGYVMFGGATMGNVYGGGFGNEDETESALVKKNTRVLISGGEIYHNVYGGGALSSVGTFSISDGTGDQAHIPVGIPYGWEDGTGTATVIITGGTVGISGRDNGMVNGSSRGEVAKPVGDPAKDPYDKVAWVNNTSVTIGKTGESGPNIKGSVYGGGENGHNAGDAKVKMYSGKVGVFSGETWYTFTNETASKKATITRGNVYGAGCGTDTYTGDDNLEHNNPWAGLVAGNTFVTVSGGEVSNNVYGGGSMGAVGTITNDLDDASYQHKSGDDEDLDKAATLYDFGLSWPLVINYASGTGKASVTVDGTAHIYGYVFGAARGNVDIGENDITKHRYVEAKFANVKETQVTIGTAGGSGSEHPAIDHSVFGGGEDGHVYENASVTIHHGNIKRSVFGGGKGEGKYTTTLRKATGTDEDPTYEDLPNQAVYSWTAGRVYGNTTVTMNGGQVGMFIYGGGNLGSVGKGNYSGGSDDYSKGGYGEMPPEGGELWSNTNFTGSGKATVNLFGGTVGDGSGTDDDGIPYGSVFGGSRGKAAASCKRSPRFRYVPDFFLGYVNKTEVNIGDASKVDDDSYDGPKVYGSIYGGGQDGHVRNNTVVKIYKGDIAGHTSDATGRSGNVFGAGSGIGTYIDTNDENKVKVNNSSGSVTCTTLVEVNGGTIAGSVYGGGALASVGPPKMGPDEQKAESNDRKSYSYTKVDIKGGTVKGSVFGASRGPGDSYLTTPPKPVFDTTERDESHPAGSYDETKYATDIWSYAYVTGGIVEGSVYGGGEGGIVRQDTEVHLTGGIIKNDAYGGGKGTANIAADVNGKTLVELNNNAGPTAVNPNLKGCVVNRLFGCNDFKGTPKGRATVHVYATQHKDKDHIKADDNDKYTPPSYDPDRLKNTDNTDEDYKMYLQRVINAAFTKDANNQPTSTFIDGINDEVKTAVNEAITVLNNLPSGPLSEENEASVIAAIKKVNGAVSKLYDVQAVYGGGNLALYEPTDPEEYTEVIIDGCEYTSIKQVYGGGNAASTPGTNVTVKAAYVIDEVFGGGNGADNYQHPIDGMWYENPGANVGYYSTSEHVVDGEVSSPGTEAKPYYKAVVKENAETKEKRQTAENGFMYGSGITTTQINGGTIHRVYGGSNKKGNIREEARSMAEAMGNCELHVGETYGAGKSAPIDGRVNQDVKCASGIEEIYGGSKNSDVNSDILLKITNGSSLKRVFGGNNTSGKVNGSITVVVEEGGCEPIHIQELYAGGYLAAYSVYGYNSDGSVKTSGDKLYKDPVINIISATRIDNIFGGGYQATVVGNPHVNVNMTNGKVIVEKKEKTNEDAATYAFEKGGKTYVYKDASGTIYDNTKVNPDLSYELPVGTIGNIYGGGNQADIIGNTYVDIGTGEWLNVDRKREMEGSYSYTDNEETITLDKTFTYNETSKKWEYPEIVTIVDTPTPITGSLPEPIPDGYQVEGTAGDITTTFTYHKDTEEWTYVETKSIEGTPTPARNAATIDGHVFGGGKGIADTFTCEKAMVGEDGKGVDEDFIDNPNYKDGNTNVIIANGTVKRTIKDGKVVGGNVYGGGEIARVEKNTTVTIGLGDGVASGTPTSAPVIEGDVFGAGSGVETHGYSALVRGNPTVTIQGNAKVLGSVYGGGEVASVARYRVVGGAPVALANTTSGNCKVTVRGYAEIGPDGMQMKKVDGSGNPLPPDDKGHVFGAGKGVLPNVYSYSDNNHRPKRMLLSGTSLSSDDSTWESAEVAGNKWEYFGNDTDYHKFIETLALSSKTDVTISDHAFVKGSVYGGSENGIVQYDTHVTIEGHCQIGCGKNTTERYPESVFTSNTPPSKLDGNGNPIPKLDENDHPVLDENDNPVYVEEDLECASWDYDKTSGAPYDPYAKADGTYDYSGPYSVIPTDKRRSSSDNGKPIGADGHTYYGNVYGGGSGVIPYAPGLWHRAAGQVRGNTQVNITGGHILTSVYGGNEHTDVGMYTNDANGEPIVPESGGKSTVNMVGGTLGVPRTLSQIAAHPVTCYLFGAGKGDQRIFFNTWTNIKEGEVNITGDARIFGSVFGGGEDGHIINDVKTTIGGSVTLTKGETSTTYTEDGVLIGTTGTSYVDGNIFGAGRGYSGEALTSGTVSGNVEVNIKGGTMLGSVYGGGRLASVGTRFTSATDPFYGQLQEDVEDDIATTDVDETKTHGHITINISGGTIGNDEETILVKHTKGGNVFGGSMGRLKLLDDQTTNPLWPKMGTVKTTKINIYGDALIKGNVYGGGEYGMTRGDTHVTIGGILGDDNVTITSTESDAPTIKRDVFGGGYGSDDFTTKTEITAGGFDANKYTFTPMQLAGIVCGDTYVNIKRGHVQKNVYGGGELATVGLIDFNGAEQHKDIRNPGTSDEKIYGFGLSWPYKMDFIPYMPDGTGPIGGTTNINVSGGRLGITGKDVLIDGGDKIDNGDIYGGSKGKAGDRYDMGFCGNVKATNITIDYPSSNGAKPENYKTDLTLPCVTGAVYGGGEDGHVIEDTHVTLKNGLVGHAIYGGGSGKGKYTQKLYEIGSTTEKHDVDIFSVTAGKVYGNTHVKMEGGYVVRFVYGGGNMGSVGKGNYSSGTDDYYPAGYGETLEHDKLWQSTFNPEQAISNTNKPDTAYYFLSSGKTEVEIIGGEIGYVDTADPTESMKDGLPYGSVFGGSRGESAPNIGESPRYWYSPQFFSGYVNETEVTIGGYRCKEDNSTYKKGDCLTAAEFNAAFPTGNSNWELVGPTIKGSVFGGGQDGHVRRDTHVIVDAGEIGMAYNTENRKKVGTLSSTTPTEEEIKSLADLDNAQWLHRGNVYGAGSGIGKYEFDFDNDGTIDKSDNTCTYKNPQTGKETEVKEYDYSTSAGSVTRYTQVDINGGTIHRNVYGGGSLSSVGPATIPPARKEFAYKPGTTTRDAAYDDGNPIGSGWWSMNTVNIKGTVGTPTDYQAHYGGEVYGASRGDLSIGEDFGTTVWTQVFIKDGARIMGNVFGGGDNGKVKRDTDVQIGEPATSSATTP